ncbi:MAG: hypothetical protein Q7S04_00560 [Candidatus Moranbacteria bacterium]|nr:hypothetical protein [Candidatus Moranbacteria bacterium]
MSDLYFRKTYSEFVEFVSNTNDELIILCPYIKLEPLKLLLEKVKPGIKVIVVARWKISDLVFGSSDIEVFEYLKSLNHSFYINNKIHLKVIIKDKRNILIGSANITGSGLGLFDSSNIEAIAIESLDEKYLPSVYSILRESIEVDDVLVNTISEKLEGFQNVREEKDKITAELGELEKQIFIKKKKGILVYDFPFTGSPAVLLKAINEKDINDTVQHDLQVLKLTTREINLSLLREAFLTSDAYIWQEQNIPEEALFGKYSELLHNALIDDPKPYRKQVKELVVNMFVWTSELSDDYVIKKYNHTQSLVRRQN